MKHSFGFWSANLTFYIHPNVISIVKFGVQMLILERSDFKKGFFWELEWIPNVFRPSICMVAKKV